MLYLNSPTTLKSNAQTPSGVFFLFGIQEWRAPCLYGRSDKKRNSGSHGRRLKNRRAVYMSIVLRLSMCKNSPAVKTK